METNPNSAPMICPKCHQPVLPTAYFCSNCGEKLSEPPLSTTMGAKAWIYASSIILPMLCFLTVKYWPGFKYARSNDPSAKRIGYIAIALMLISTIVTFWLAAVVFQQMMQVLTSGVGGLGI